MAKILKDKFFLKDKVNGVEKLPVHKSGFWARTRVQGGYGLHKNSAGISYLDEVVFEEENMVPIGGVQYAMEMIAGVKGPLTIPTLNDKGIGAQGSTIEPSGGNPYPYGQKVCLFGVGSGGAAENNLTVIEPKYYDSNIYDMYPLRYTNEPLSDSDSLMYYGKKIVDGVQAYYLKRFDSEPIIHHLFKDAPEGEDGTEIDSSIFVDGTDLGMESFTEYVLSVSRKDAREWFDAAGNIELARVNSVGLFTAIYDAELHDYANIQLFSLLNIPSEPLVLTKDMTLLYRVYGA